MKRIVGLLFPRLVKTADGVFQPWPPGWLEIALMTSAVVVTLLLTLHVRSGMPWMGLMVPCGLAIGFGLRSLLERRRFGPRGLPFVALRDGTLLMTHCPTSRDEFRIELAQAQRLVIYGPTGHRIYRFIQHDGGWREAQPQWKRKAEALVIEFLQDTLRERVVLEEPQTGFAQARGDGPYFGS